MDLDNLKEIENHPRYTFVEGDICKRVLVEDLSEKYSFSGIIRSAAESHVDNSIKNPDTFVRTNEFGTFNLSDVAKNYWKGSSK